MWRLGSCLKHKQDGQPYRIIQVTRKTNHKGQWDVYTVQHVFSNKTRNLRVRNLKRMFETDKTAQILYGISGREAKVLYAKHQKQTKSLRKLLALGSLYGTKSGRWSTEYFGTFTFPKHNKNSSD